MTKAKETSDTKVLVKYIYETDFHTNKRPVAAIVSTDVDCIGVSVCNPKDAFNKKRARDIAANRANLYAADDESILEKVPDRPILTWYAWRNTPIENELELTSLKDEVRFNLERMRERAKKYFLPKE